MTEILKDPYEGIDFEIKHVQIHNAKGEVIFDEHTEFPKDFDDNAAAIVASRYLCNNAKRKETSIKQMFDRVSDTITRYGIEQGYLVDDKKAEVDHRLIGKDNFNYKLKKYQIDRLFAFNSPTYFNTGLVEPGQTSACFILKIEDNMESISNIGKLESTIFKKGSGSGINYSTLRGSKEKVSGGGLASGPISFLKSHDTNAGIIRSGGTLRRSAKLARLDVNHPDIEDFINCKLYEEEKLRLLKSVGIHPRKGYELTDEVFYQNTNLTVGVSDKFMRAVIDDEEWTTYTVIDKKRFKTYKARDLMKLIAENNWKIADPGLQFDDTINEYNTCANLGRINSSNP